MDWKQIGEKALEAVIIGGGLATIGSEVFNSITKVRNGTADEEDKALVKAYYDKINKSRLAQIDTEIKKMNAEKLLLLQDKTS